MSDLLERIRTDVHARLSELRPLVEEHRRLETALRVLTGGDVGASGPAAVSEDRTRAGGRRQTPVASGRSRAPRGANRRAVLEAVRERPGATAAELAAVSGLKRNALYGVLRRLVQDGAVQTRQLPTGRTGYALGAPRPAEPADATKERALPPAAETTSATQPEPTITPPSATASPQPTAPAAQAPASDQSSEVADETAPPKAQP